jgi:glycosyltransferase involved in cell wall biosynthesis
MPTLRPSVAILREVRILFLTPTLGVGGAERLVVAESAALAARGHDVAVAFGVIDVQGEPLDAAGVRRHRVSAHHLGSRTLLSWARAVRRIVRDSRPDVIYAHSVTAAIVARIAAPRTPLLVTVHGIASESESRAARILRLVRARVTAVSEQTADGLRRHGIPDVDVLPPGVDIAALQAATRLPARGASIIEAEREVRAGPPDAPVEGRPRFACVARQEPEKGVDVLIAAFPRVLEAFPEAALAVIGLGTQMAANQAAATADGVRERVEFCGVLTNPAPAIAAADVIVLPSRREGLPVVVLEAFALERPVVASNVGGTPDVVRDGDTGWLVPPEDPEALAAALIVAAGDPAEARARGVRGSALVAERYSIAALVDRVEAILRSLTA